jgi:hypothetical protein
LWSYLKIGGPFVLVIMLDYWAWELMTVMSGRMSIDDQAA